MDRIFLRLNKKVEAQTTIVAKAKRAANLSEMEIEWLRSELRQSSDRETDVWAKARTDKFDKLDAEITAHKQTIELLNKQMEAISRTEGIIEELGEVA